MKLILSVDALSPSLSGIGRYTWELASRLKYSPRVNKIRYFRNEQWVNDPSSLLSIDTSSKTKKKIKYPRWCKNLYWKSACMGNVFHTPNFFLPPYADNGIVTVHDLSVFKFPETHPLERVKHFEKSFQRTLDIASHIITDTETTRQEVIDYFGWPSNRISYVHLGVSTTFKPHKTEQVSPILRKYNLEFGLYTLCVATIEPRKKIDALIQAYSLLPLSLRILYPLVLVGGKGWRSEYIHELIYNAENEGWLKYFGFMPEKDLPAIYAGARLFAYPSTYEGFGLPPIEAMASGIPVIVSNKSCLPEVTKGAAMYITPDDCEGFCKALEIGLIDNVWRVNATNNGQEVAKTYSWEFCVDNTISIYQSI